MTVRVFHQLGHNANWGTDSFLAGNGDGLILSPVHQAMQQLGRQDAETKQAALFDPQFYIPDSQKPKLLTYPFFPGNVPAGFDPSSFTAHSMQVARDCVEFQESEPFKAIVIPLRFLDQLYPDYIEQQEQLFLRPFLAAIEERDVSKPVYLSLPLTGAMITHGMFRDMILNWITQFPELDGIYLNYQFSRESKQIESDDFLLSALTFVRKISDAKLEVVVGHQNTEALLFSLIEDVTVTIGTFENTRIFSVDKFLTSEEDRRGPRARIYLPGLLNWIQFEEARQIQRGAGLVWSRIYHPSEYSERALSLPTEPAFNQPALYKHHIENIVDQFEKLNSLDKEGRRALLIDWIRQAMSDYSSIDRANVAIDRHGSGLHLGHWLNAISRFT
jgi:hypothetical protein